MTARAPTSSDGTCPTRDRSRRRSPRIKDDEHAREGLLAQRLLGAARGARVARGGGDTERRTLIALPHPFIVPGGRFVETYYWDNYWILKGLLVCGMRETAAGMIRNMLHQLDAFGFVPNGGRIYYLDRSQPPSSPRASLRT